MAEGVLGEHSELLRILSRLAVFHLPKLRNLRQVRLRANSGWGLASTSRVLVESRLNFMKE